MMKNVLCAIGISIIIFLLSLSGCINPVKKIETGSRYLDGFVYTSTGDPVYNVPVDINFENFGEGLSTDQNGYFNFSHSGGFPIGPCTLTISMGDTKETYTINIEKNMSAIEIFLPVDKVPNGTYCGYITDFAGRPIRNVSVYESERDISVVTDEHGFYGFENISPGTVILIFNAKGYHYDGTHQTGLLAFEPVRFLNVSFATIGNDLGGIDGTIIDSKTKTAINNAQVMMLLNGEIKSTVSDGNGYYTFSNLTPKFDMDSYKLLVAKDGYVITSISVEVSSNVTTRQDINLRSLGKDFSMGGFLMDESGTPIESAYFELSRYGGYSKSYESGGTYGCGSSSWSSGLPAQFHVKITSEGYKTLEDDVMLAEGLTLLKNYTLIKQ